MADNTYILEQFRANNPFSSVASPLPWENTTPDLYQLNTFVSIEIEQLIRDKRRQPSLPLSGMVFGEQGFGKTHMLTRILRRLRRNAWHAIFVNIRAFVNSKRIAQDLLSEIILSLMEIHSAGHSQFDMLISEMMNVYHERRREDGIAGDDTSKLKIYLRRDMPRIDRTFLKCILLYVGTSDIELRENIMEWLRTGLDDEDCLALGLPMRNVYSMEDAACESAAKNIIMSLGILLAYARIPMILCFDELDTIEDKKELIRAWGDIIGFIMNNISGMLPLCFVRSGIWERVFIPELNQAIIQRLRTNTMKMQGCSQEQAKQLIHDRIAATFSDGVEEKYNWLISRMGNALTSGMSPRAVIELARRTLTETPSDPIKEAYLEEFKKVQTEPRSWPPNTDHMILALTSWLAAHSGCEVHGSWGRHVKVVATLGDQHIALALPVPKTAPTATAAVNECFKFINEYPASFCCYVKENKAHKPTWRAFNRKLEEFAATSCGHVLELDDKSRITWYALAATINQINNGNVNIYTPTGNRTATLDDARDFLKSIDLIPGLFSPQPKDDSAPQPQMVDIDTIKEKLIAAIKTSPMQILAVEKALALLAGKQIHISRNELLAYVNDHKDSFRLFQSKGKETVFGLVGK